MTKKYELIDRGTLCYRIKALIDIPRNGVKAGDLGGQVHGEHNLSHEGDCWIEWGSSVLKHAQIQDNAIVRDGSIISDRSRVTENAVVQNCAVWNYSVITDNAVVNDCYAGDHCIVRGNSQLKGLYLKGNCDIQGHTRVINPKSVHSKMILKLQGELTDKDILFQGPALSSGNYSLGIKTLDGVRVSTGCFEGTLDEYLAAIEDTHKDIPRYLTQYRQFHENFVNYFSQ